jgi:hypothetical protein
MSEEQTTVDSKEQITEYDKERFIPIGKQEIVADLLAAPHWNAEEQQQFCEFCQIFAALYHYKFHSHLEEMKRCYSPFDPDTDIVTQSEFSDEEEQKRHNILIDEMRQLLNHANYEELTVDDINKAMNADSYYGVSVSVDLRDFVEMITYYRGASTKVEYKRTWRSLFFSKERFEIPIYKRLFLLIKFKAEDKRFQEFLDEQELDKDEMGDFQMKVRKTLWKSKQNMPQGVTDEHAFIKLFKNMPRSDLAMLFPNQRVRFRLFDKIKLAVTGGGGTIFGIFTTITKVAVAVNPITILLAFGGLIGIIIRQIMGIFTERNKYMMVLSRNLYFHNMNNNVGVINYLIDMAEEEEGKEAILAYYFLHTLRDKNYTLEALDREIENYIQDKYGLAIDFEVDDGVRKLRDEGILIEQEGGILKVLDLHKTCVRLDKKWDDFFNPDDGVHSQCIRKNG